MDPESHHNIINQLTVTAAGRVQASPAQANLLTRADIWQKVVERSNQTMAL